MAAQLAKQAMKAIGPGQHMRHLASKSRKVKMLEPKSNIIFYKTGGTQQNSMAEGYCDYNEFV